MSLITAYFGLYTKRLKSRVISNDYQHFLKLTYLNCLGNLLQERQAMFYSVFNNHLSLKSIIFLVTVFISSNVAATQVYLEDADTTIPPSASNPNTVDVSGALWPRVIICLGVCCVWLSFGVDYLVISTWTSERTA